MTALPLLAFANSSYYTTNVGYVSRSGEKLQFAIDSFKIDIENLVCADFGSSTGGFVDCLLQNGARKVYAVEVGYGTVDWKLRNDPRVFVMERTNAIHANLAEKVDFISIDTGWTKQQLIIPNALANLKEGGNIVCLIKPHYEADKKYLVKGRLKDEEMDEVLENVKKAIRDCGAEVVALVESPIVGKKGRNREFLALVMKKAI